MRELRGINPSFWLANMIVALAFTGAFWLYGALSGGFDTPQECESRGQPLDTEYRRLNWEEPGRYFPLHNKCNADYDLVPFWLNPALVFLALLALAFAAAFVLSLSRWRKFRKPRV